MIRNIVLALAATAAIGAASLTSASAHGFGFGHHGFGWGGYGYGYNLSLIGTSSYVVNQSCHQYQTFVTPSGHVKHMRVNVCVD